MYFRELLASYGDDSAPFCTATIGVYGRTQQQVATEVGLLADILMRSHKRSDIADEMIATLLANRLYASRLQGGQS